MKRVEKLNKKAAELSATLPIGTRVRFWPGNRFVAPVEGTVIREFYVLQGHTVVCPIKAAHQDKTHWVIAASHVEKVA